MATDDSAILVDTRHARADLQLTKRSARCQWPVDATIKRRAVEVAAELMESERTAEVVAGVNALIQMDRANIAAEKADAPREQHNTQVNVYMPANSREAARPEATAVAVSNATETPACLTPAVGQGRPLDCEIVQVTPVPTAPGR